MHLLITRPEPDATAMRETLQAEGLSADVAPLLEIAVNMPDATLLKRASALVVTSRNGLRALEGFPGLTDLLARPLLVVGRATGVAARDLGFQDVSVGPATAKDLVPLIIAAWRNKILPASHAAKLPEIAAGMPGPVVHLSGDKISFDLAPPLAQAGIPLERTTVYSSQPAQQLPQNVAETLARSGYDAVILMSPLTADTYIDLVLERGLTAGARKAEYLCLSRGISERLVRLGAGKLKIARKPNIEEMVALIRETAAQSD